MRAKKKFGQHFLSDPRILGRIADAIAARPRDVVVEIGPGTGNLTAQLVGRGARVIAIERDADLVPRLRDRLPDVTVVEGDALELDWHALVGSAPWVAAGNIPYNITSPLIDKALDPPRPRAVIFLVQREVADRLAAAPGSDAYGALSVGVQAVADVERLFLVPAGAFHPPPRVDSALVRLVPRSNPLIADAQVAGFRRLVVGLFGFRRKQLLRGLRELTGWGPDPARVALEAAGIQAAIRPEALSPEQFVKLLAVLVDGGWVPE